MHEIKSIEDSSRISETIIPVQKKKKNPRMTSQSCEEFRVFISAGNDPFNPSAYEIISQGHLTRRYSHSDNYFEIRIVIALTRVFRALFVGKF